MERLTVAPDAPDLPALPPGRRATIKDVAEGAAVSRSTASRALTGRGYVAPGVRERVRRTAQALGYVPDAGARNLRQQVSRSVGVLVSDLRNSFYADLAAGVGQQSRRRGYAMMLSDDNGSPERELEAAEAFVALRVAGVILTPLSAEVSEYLHRHRVPVVEVDRQFCPGRCDAVVVDNRGAARRVTEGLLAQGHVRIALLIDEADWTTGRDRAAGFAGAVDDAGRPVEAFVVRAGWHVEEARERVRALLEGPSAPTALFAANNVLAEGAWRAAQDLGRRIPEDLSLVSFDDAAWMSMVGPGVTAVAQDVVALGEAAVSALFERIDQADAPARTVMLAARVAERGSTAPPPAS
ncbi:LacI family DNA-binding transcriptional regulator [Cellulomonas marina]|uniref:LacI family transcriptional regulator/LacI family transcriptional regulator, fructose operon transcriptional repressor n=1 Tax=Cellulomonas marina TaxID=988821 RepID=A0A1I1A9L5_9CELL|nr:LacI family DNA-binding transcriptional regulator [Cellulomonas marina]GIG29569.1 LacI family transcriptional regulator [Cellulomonas marina]SFB33188.1 LacI family transcriptional regulator/LacI family transcriptional regulator, fructose operon transcriptional repressor [Cellulomonas marina]